LDSEERAWGEKGREGERRGEKYSNAVERIHVTVPYASRGVGRPGELATCLRANFDAFAISEIRDIIAARGDRCREENERDENGERKLHSRYVIRRRFLLAGGRYYFSRL
jgi:hypothetical protein